MTTTAEQLLDRARRRLKRLDAPSAAAAVHEGDAILVDIRSDLQRATDGTVPGAIRIARNVLEWRCEPDGAACDAAVSDPARRLILMCDEGYQSSLAAATLVELGHPRATDLVGGFRAWRAAGLPVGQPAGGARSGEGVEPSSGVGPARTGFEDRVGHRAPAAPGP